MSVTDFLFQGQPPPSINTYGTTANNVPQWLSDYTQGLLARGNAAAAEPYQAYGGPRVADFTSDQNLAFQGVRNMQGAYSPTLQQGISATSQSMGVSPLAAASPTLNRAAGMSPSEAGMPYLGSAAQSAAGSVGQYMSPYQDAVVSRIGDLAARQFREKLMPEVSDTFARAGQFGSSRMQEATGRALRDVQESALAEQGKLMNQGYQGALTAAQEDLKRRAQVGQVLGNLEADEQRTIAQIGQVQGNLQTAANQGMLGAGAQLGNLALAGQRMGYADTAALEAIGQQQQNLGQRSLDTRYQDFIAQRNYPREQVGFMSNIVRGVPYSQTTNTVSNAPASTYQPSGLAQIIGGLSAVREFGNMGGRTT
jgi:hypothetical protein